MPTATETIKRIAERDYEFGFVTDIEQDTIPAGLDEDIIRLISAKKEEPEYMLEWRLKAYRHWLTLKEPTWAAVNHAPRLRGPDGGPAPGGNVDAIVSAPRTPTEVRAGSPRNGPDEIEIGLPPHGRRRLMAGIRGAGEARARNQREGARRGRLGRPGDQKPLPDA